MVYLYLTNLGEPWIAGYFAAFLVDFTIVAYGVLYFISAEGRPSRWTVRRLVCPLKSGPS